MAKITQINNKDYIFCDWRKKYVRLTPEEWVRQQFLHQLVDTYGFPTSLIGVEVALQDKRADAVVYRKDMTPLVLLEFKAQTVPLTQNVLDQAVIYNRQLHVPYLILHNGPQTIIAQVEDSQLSYLNTIPQWSQL